MTAMTPAWADRSWNPAKCLTAPLRYRKPARIAVTGDLFHEDVPDQFIVDVFGIEFEYAEVPRG